VILAVADGHGSARYSRSDRGAALAVQCAQKLLREMLISMQQENLSPAAVESYAKEGLPKALVRSWRAGVEADLDTDPVPTNQADGYLLYGSTLLAVAVTERFALWLNIGDGDGCLVTETGEIHRAVTPDARLLGTETYSLVQKDAWRHVQVSLGMFGDQPPALILLATDGLSNSFASPQGFERTGPDLLAMLQEQGVDQVAADLPDWLGDVSAEGSGDDITLLLAYREGAEIRLNAGSSEDTRALSSSGPKPSRRPLSSAGRSRSGRSPLPNRGPQVGPTIRRGPISR
jgi:serine/threonine protein phosphatase PrpC